MVTMSSGREFLSGHGRGRVPAAYVNLFCWVQVKLPENSRARVRFSAEFSRAYLYLGLSRAHGAGSPRMAEIAPNRQV